MSTSSELQAYAVQRLFKAMQNDISQVLSSQQCYQQFNLYLNPTVCGRYTAESINFENLFCYNIATGGLGTIWLNVCWQEFVELELDDSAKRIQ